MTNERCSTYTLLLLQRMYHGDIAEDFGSAYTGHSSADNGLNDSFVAAKERKHKKTRC